MIYFKLKSTLILTITAIALFIVSCEQAAINSVPDINETANLSAHDALVANIAAEQSLKDILDHIYGELAENEEDISVYGSVYGEYIDNVLFLKYPQLAEMERADALNVVAEAVSQMDFVEMRGCHCWSGCHYCCLTNSVGGNSWCWERYCFAGGWCN